MRHTKSFLAAAITAAMLPSFAQAAGTFLPEGASPGLGMAGAGDVVNTGNAAVMWANPAAMAGLDGEMMTINGMIFDLSAQFKNNGSVGLGTNEGDNAGGILPAGGFFYHVPLDEKVSFGLAVSSLGGAALDYGNDWIGKGMLTNTSLMSLQINPSMSYRINDQWSVGGGIQLNYAWMEMETAVATMNTANDWASGFNLGVYFTPTDKLSLGLAYRSKVEHDFSDSLYVSSDNLNPADMSYSVDMPYVAQLNFGGSYEFTERTKMYGSLGWQQWSDMEATPMSVSLGVTNEGSIGTEIYRGWEDTWSFAAGVEHKLNQKWTLKTGVSYETAALDDATLQRPDLPSGEQFKVAFGAATTMGDWDMNFFYEYANLGEVDINSTGASGTVKGTFEDYRVHFVGMSATQKF